MARASSGDALAAIPALVAGMSWVPATELARKGRAGARRNLARYMVEGEQVTFEQIAKRVGCTTRQARERVRQAGKVGAVTWAALKR